MIYNSLSYWFEINFDKFKKMLIQTNFLVKSMELVNLQVISVRINKDLVGLLKNLSQCIYFVNPTKFLLN